MGTLKTLREEYPGHKAWEEFVSCFEAEFSPEVFALQIDIDICAVVTGKIGRADSAVKWLRTEIPALDGRSALQVFTSEVEGREIIRSLLMRLP